MKLPSINWRCSPAGSLAARVRASIELASLITGLISLAMINRTEAGSRVLYQGQSDREDIGCAKIVVWLLVALPFTLFVSGTLWWVETTAETVPG